MPMMKNFLLLNVNFHIEITITSRFPIYSPDSTFNVDVKNGLTFENWVILRGDIIYAVSNALKKNTLNINRFYIGMLVIILIVGRIFQVVSESNSQNYM